MPYKQHKTIILAVKYLRDNNSGIGERIRVHFTVTSQDFPDLYRFVHSNNLENQIIFQGKIPHEKLLEMYQSSVGLLFPSTIETLGLPLIEAARFGLPIIASDMDYAKEVLDGYEGVEFIPYNNYTEWAEQMKVICLNRKRFPAMTERMSSWPDFFQLIKSIISQTSVL